MDPLKITLEHDQVKLVVDDGCHYDHCVIVNVGYLAKGGRPYKWQGCYLTPKRAERLRNWLSEWIKEHNPPGS